MQPYFNISVRNILIIYLLTSTACNQSLFSGTGLSGQKSKSQSGNVIGASISDTAIVAEDDWFNSLSKMEFAELSKVSMSDYIRVARERITNDPVNIDGVSFFDLKDFTDRHEDLYRDLEDQYSTIGEYFDAVDIADITEILPESRESGYAKLEPLFSSGEIEDILLAHSNDDSQSSDTGEQGMNLDASGATGQLQLRQTDTRLKNAIAMAVLVPQTIGTQLQLQDGQSVPAPAGAGAQDYNKVMTITDDAGRVATCTPGSQDLCQVGTNQNGHLVMNDLSDPSNPPPSDGK